jgi:hypothetical protein
MIRTERIESVVLQPVELPEGVVKFMDLTVGGKTPRELEKLIDKTEGVTMGDGVRYDLHTAAMNTLDKPKKISLIRANPRVMGLPDNSTLEEIFKRAEELGWEKVPAETAFYLALKLKNEKLWSNGLWMGMEPITSRVGSPSINLVHRPYERINIGGRTPVHNDSIWHEWDEFVFALPQTEEPKKSWRQKLTSSSK